MKLVYIANILLPSEYAHTVQIMKMCEAFANNGVDVLLIVPRRKNHNKTNPFEYYGTKVNFKIKYLPCIDFFYDSSSKMVYWIRLVSFYISSYIYLLFRPYSVIYTRELYIPFLFNNVYVERHSFLKKVSIQTILFNKVTGIIVLTSFIKERIVAAGVSSTKIIVAPDAVNMEDFSVTVESQKNDDLTYGRIRVGYIGTLKTMNEEKGVMTLIESIKYLPLNVSLYIVGGEKQHVDYYENIVAEKEISDRVVFVGMVPHKDVPNHIALCDIVVAPFPYSEHYAYFMSPLKIFEYMASKRPMVVTDLPSLREVLTDGETALFVPPSDPEALACAIEKLCTDKMLSQKLADNAFNLVSQKYTWNNRAKEILSHIQQ